MDSLQTDHLASIATHAPAPAAANAACKLCWHWCLCQPRVPVLTVGWRPMAAGMPARVWGEVNLVLVGLGQEIQTERDKLWHKAQVMTEN